MFDGNPELSHWSSVIFYFVLEGKEPAFQNEDLMTFKIFPLFRILKISLYLA